MTSRVVLAHSPAVGAQANAIAAQLTALGYEVTKQANRAALAGAQKVIVLWSRAARGTPALQAAARRAQASGKLVCVRLDSASPPAEAGGARAVRLPRGRAQSAAWRRLLNGPRRVVARSAAPAPAMRLPARPARRPAVVATPAHPAPASHAAKNFGRVMGVLAALALLALAAGSEAYVRDPAFAARVTELTGAAQAKAQALIASLTP